MLEPMRDRAITIAFVISGVAGLTYEVLWSRYLSLFVGHSAYAQVLVLSVYLGGMAIGALAIARAAERAERPLLWYALAECVLALCGVAFHWVYVAVTEAAYSTLLPALGDASSAGALRWALAGCMILPQAMILGATFPLMAAGLVRSTPDEPGGAVSRAYFLNTIGGAAGVLVAGFVLIGRLGLPGTSLAAAALNATAAGLVFYAVRGVSSLSGQAARTGRRGRASEVGVGLESSPRHGSSPRDESSLRHESSPQHESREAASEGRSPAFEGVVVSMAAVAFGTALASFTYEIGWIRMLSLVLGSATHAFELMLSAFILGLALGARWVRSASDRSTEPVRMLARIQVAMGIAAALSLPLYLLTFDAVAAMIPALSGRPWGYDVYNLGRYALCLMVMLPATVLAGATLPAITAVLLRAGVGERAIGLVYGVNTFGAVLGAGLAGLVALPFLGLKMLVLAGAFLDVVIGLALYGSVLRKSEGRGELAGAASVAALSFLLIGSLVRFDPTVIAGGVFRQGNLPTGDNRVSLYYQDGRTATVSAHLGLAEGLVVLATNGKPDASLSSRWMHDRRDTLPEMPIPTGRDFTTQVLAPIVGLAHNPGASLVANIGHGSGMTGASLLTSSGIDRLVTIEIEPLMVEGSLVFMPANQGAFSDPRASFVFDDAKSYFAYRPERFDVVFSEPSNPWVSGTSSLFTVEFYRQVAAVLAPNGVLTQWMQTYELSDELFLTVISALNEVFPFYRAYLVGDGDLAIVASRSSLDDPDWSVLQTDAFRDFTRGAPPFEPQHVEALEVFDQGVLRGLLARGVRPNSDFHPVLDVGAERARFARTWAEGVRAMAASRVDLTRYLQDRAGPPRPYVLPPSKGLLPSVRTERASWLRQALVSGGGVAPDEYGEWQEELVVLKDFLLLTRGEAPIVNWGIWASMFVRVEAALHWGTWGFVDPVFYGAVFEMLEREAVPAEGRAAVDLLHGYSLADWPRVAAAVDVLLDPVARGEGWFPADVLLALAVVAYLEVGRVGDARLAVDRLVPRTGWDETHLRRGILEAMVDEASGGG